VALLSCDLSPAGPLGGARLLALVDVCFPCDLSCRDCSRGRQRGIPNRSAALAVGARLADVAASAPVETVSAVFFGGEPLLDAEALCAAAGAVRDACQAAGRAFEASVMTNGLLLDDAAGRRLAGAGFTSVQIGLPAVPGPRAHGAPDLQRLALALRNARAARDALDVLVRIETDGPGQLRAALDVVSLLDREGLLAPPRPAAVLLGARAPYAAQARALLIAPALRRAALAAGDVVAAVRAPRSPP